MVINNHSNQSFQNIGNRWSKLVNCGDVDNLSLNVVHIFVGCFRAIFGQYNCPSENFYLKYLLLSGPCRHRIIEQSSKRLALISSTMSCNLWLVSNYTNLNLSEYIPQYYSINWYKAHRWMYTSNQINFNRIVLFANRQIELCDGHS